MNRPDSTTWTQLTAKDAAEDCKQPSSQSGNSRDWGNSSGLTTTASALTRCWRWRSTKVFVLACDKREQFLDGTSALQRPLSAINNSSIPVATVSERSALRIYRED